MYGDVCYEKCAPCLQAGIDALHAVTTRCSYAIYPLGNLGHKSGCDIGFDYGTRADTWRMAMLSDRTYTVSTLRVASVYINLFPCLHYMLVQGHSAVMATLSLWKSFDRV